MRNDIKEIQSMEEIMVAADKTRNMYKLSKDNYNKIIKENITKTYQKVDSEVLTKINEEAQNIASKLDLDERIECITKGPAFIPMKDHKENFTTRPS